MEMKCITGYIYLLYILSVTCDPCPYIYTNTQLETPYIIDTHGLTQYTPGVALNITIYSTESFQKATFQVIDVTSSLSVGSLSAADPIKTIRCSNNGKADFPDYNNYINLIWTPPSAYKSSVKIRISTASKYPSSWPPSYSAILSAKQISGSSLTTTPPPGGVWSCDFETSLCGLIQDTYDQFDWLRWSGFTPSEDTGPSQAYSGQYYIYIECTGRNNNDTARLTIPAVLAAGVYCLRFAYHMYGFHINQLYITLGGSTIWSHQHNQGDRWYTAAVTAAAMQGSMIDFIASRGQEYSGDIAVDNISLTYGPC